MRKRPVGQAHCCDPREFSGIFRSVWPLRPLRVCIKQNGVISPVNVAGDLLGGATAGAGQPVEGKTRLEIGARIGRVPLAVVGLLAVRLSSSDSKEINSILPAKNPASRKKMASVALQDGLSPREAAGRRIY